MPVLGEQQEDQAHHHGDCADVGFVRVQWQDVRAVAAGLLLGLADCADQQLNGPADLNAERLGDFLPVFLALVQQRGQGLVIGHAEETGPAKQRGERAGEVAFLPPQAGVERGLGGRLPLRGAHQHPPPAAGRQAQRDVLLAQ